MVLSKRFYKILLVALIFLGVFMVTTNIKAENEPKPIDVFILSGQSNMVGVGHQNRIESKYLKTYPNVKILNTGQTLDRFYEKWTVVQPGLGSPDVWYHGTEMYGPELGMAEILNKPDEEIAFIKYAVGGTGITNRVHSVLNWHGIWGDVNYEGELYQRLFWSIEKGMSDLVEQGYAPTIKGFAWMQGETDGEPQSGVLGALEYEENLTQLLAHVRTRLNLPNLPVVIGEIYEYSDGSVNNVRIIVEAQNKVAKLPNNYLVETGDLPIKTGIDTWHWSDYTAYELGIRFGQKMYEAVYMNK